MLKIDDALGILELVPRMNAIAYRYRIKTQAHRESDSRPQQVQNDDGCPREGWCLA